MSAAPVVPSAPVAPAPTWRPRFTLPAILSLSGGLLLCLVALVLVVVRFTPDAPEPEASKPPWPVPGPLLPPPEAPPPLPAVAPPRWADPRKESLTAGDITVQVTEVKLTLCRLARLGNRDEASGLITRKPLLRVGLRLKNNSQVRRHTLGGWNDDFGGVGPVVTDEHGNRYFNDRGEYIGHLRYLRIGPDETVEGAIFFEQPVAAARRLRLEISASAWGQQGVLRFEIPREMVVEE
jgi:hypothetical protein